MRGEEGHLRKHEDPTFHKGETGKGVSVGGRHIDNPSTSEKVGGDRYAGQLKKLWGQALSAATKFKR